jgi:hypothetical protein
MSSARKHFFSPGSFFLSPALKGHFELAPRVAGECVFAQAFYFSLTWKIKEKTPGKCWQIHLLFFLRLSLIPARSARQTSW